MNKCIGRLRFSKYFKDAIEHTHFTSVMSEIGFSPYLTLSNLGDTSASTIPNMPDGATKMQLTEHYFSLTGIASFDYYLIAQFLITFKGRFMFNVVHNPRIVSRSFVDTYLDKLDAVLRRYCLAELI